MSRTTKENLDERQGEIEMLARLARELAEHVDNAESCESPEDFDRNLDEAIATARAFIELARGVRS